MAQAINKEIDRLNHYINQFCPEIEAPFGKKYQPKKHYTANIDPQILKQFAKNIGKSASEEFLSKVE